MTDEDETMGTTATPGTTGAAAIDEPDNPNGSANGDPRARSLGGELDDPDLPYDRRPAPDDPTHGVA
jgi:hypothetical protein